MTARGGGIIGTRSHAADADDAYIHYKQQGCCKVGKSFTIPLPGYVCMDG